MVSQSAIAGLVVQCMISILIPIFVYVFMKKKYKISFRPVLVGAAIFIGFVLILEGALNAYVLHVNETTAKITEHPYWFTLYGSLMAGVFEEVGRFIAFTYLLKVYRDRKDGLAFGLGHGGIEAIIIGGITAIQSIVYAQLLNTGKLETAFGKLPPEALQGIKDSLLDLTFVSGIMGGAERIAALVLQIALSILVLYAVKEKKFSYVMLAIFLHTLVDYVVFLHRTIGLSLMVVEVFLWIVAICSYIFIKRSKSLFNI
jgi:uncharacterized membrane protein YhfC